MNYSATNSSIDAAYYLLQLSELDGIYLETEKLQHLLFLAQIEFAADYQNQMLMPCVFMCDKNGFFEPGLRRIFEQGRPFMPPVKLHREAGDFLKNIWKKYGKLSIQECRSLVLKTPLYAKCHQEGKTTVLTWNSLIDNLHIYAKMNLRDNLSTPRRKVLVSQNGPVVVSQWTPRKLDRINL